MKKTNELIMFEEMVAKHLVPETPKHANEVTLQGFSSDFISQTQDLYKAHMKSAMESDQKPDDKL